MKIIDFCLSIALMFLFSGLLGINLFLLEEKGFSISTLVQSCIEFGLLITSAVALAITVTKR